MKLSDHLSEHFTYGEMIQSDTAARLGLQNTPNPVQLANLRVNCAGLELVRAFLGYPLTVTSGFRGEILNDHIPGSSDTSDHTKGFATDFRCPKFGTPYEICKAIAGNPDIPFDEMIHEFRSWCHISFKPLHRRELLTKFAGQPIRAGILK